jgi:hypothetical protein
MLVRSPEYDDELAQLAAEICRHHRARGLQSCRSAWCQNETVDVPVVSKPDGHLKRLRLFDHIAIGTRPQLKARTKCRTTTNRKDAAGHLH